jgi:hypothetical protein
MKFNNCTTKLKKHNFFIKGMYHVGFACSLALVIALPLTSCGKKVNNVKFTSFQQFEDFFDYKMKKYDSEDDKFSVPLESNPHYSEKILDYFFTGERL